MVAESFLICVSCFDENQLSFHELLIVGDLAIIVCVKNKLVIHERIKLNLWSALLFAAAAAFVGGGFGFLQL